MYRLSMNNLPEKRINYVFFVSILGLIFKTQFSIARFAFSFGFLLTSLLILLRIIKLIKNRKKIYPNTTMLILGNVILSISLICLVYIYQFWIMSFLIKLAVSIAYLFITINLVLVRVKKMNVYLNSIFRNYSFIWIVVMLLWILYYIITPIQFYKYFHS